MNARSYFVGILLLTWTGTTQAQGRYARPPDDSWEYPPPPVEAPESTLRLSVGPALRTGADHTHGGLMTMLDLGSKAAGGRLTGTWSHVGSDGGLSQYTAELWVDFGAHRRLRPIVGAGAGVARLEENDGTGSLRTSTLGLGVLRGTLEYVLPVNGVDARVGIDLQGALPAIRSSGSPEVDGWLIAAARVGVGF
jgi:hypothetical protein